LPRGNPGEMKNDRSHLHRLGALPAVVELELRHRAGVKTAGELIPPISTKNKHRIKT
jgi:hypothetical protein